MSRTPSLRAIPWLAVGGLLVGHALTVAVTASHPAQAGPDVHGYLAWASRVGVVAALLGLAGLLIGRMTSGDRTPPSPRGLAVRLSSLQVGAFVLMEVGERVGVGASLADLPRILPVGVVAQVVVAVVVAAAVTWLLRTGDRARERLGRASPAERPRVSWTLGMPLPPLGTVGAGADRARAPPA